MTASGGMRSLSVLLLKKGSGYGNASPLSRETLLHLASGHVMRDRHQELVEGDGMHFAERERNEIDEVARVRQATLKLGPWARGCVDCPER